MLTGVIYVLPVLLSVYQGNGMFTRTLECLPVLWSTLECLPVSVRQASQDSNCELRFVRVIKMFVSESSIIIKSASTLVNLLWLRDSVSYIKFHNGSSCIKRYFVKLLFFIFKFMCLIMKISP